MGMRSFAELLRIYRGRSNFSQESLAEHAAISVAAVGALERASRRAPYAQTVGRLADALGLSPIEREEFQLAAAAGRNRRERSSGVALDSTNTFPEALTSFVDRPEIDAIVELVRQNRLVTIAGTGGIGKTRSALEVAARGAGYQAACISFFDLAEITDSGAIVSALAALLKVRLAGTADAIDTIAQALLNQRRLLLFDNCEHVLNATSKLVDRLLKGCPKLSILATSRVPLGLSNECVYRLPSLDVPDVVVNTVETARSYSALELFLRRAESADAHSSIAGEHLHKVTLICRRLDGIPLALELAAARLPTLGFDGLLGRLNGSLISLGGRDRPPRHRTMEATIDWSYELLDESERQLFRRLSVFSGGFTLDAAEQVCADGQLPQTDIEEALSQLVTKSLVHVRASDQATRYAFLFSLREYAANRLEESGETAMFRRRHSEWLETLATYFSNNRWTIRSVDYMAEYENVLSGIVRGLQGTEEDVLAAAVMLVGFGFRLSLPANMFYRFISQALERLDEDKHPEIVLRLLNYSVRTRVHGERVELASFSARALRLCEMVNSDDRRVELNRTFAILYCERGWTAEAEAALARADAACSNGTVTNGVHADYLTLRAYIRSVDNRLDEARADLQHSIRLSTQNGFEEERLNALATLAEVECAAGDYHNAVQYCRDALRSTQLRSDQRSIALGNLVGYLLLQGDIAGAQSHAVEAFIFSRGKYWTESAIVIQHFATACAIFGAPVRAARLLGYVNEWYRQTNRSRVVAEQRGYELLMGSLHEQLTEKEIAASLAAGTYLSEVEVVEEIIASQEMARLEAGSARTP